MSVLWDHLGVPTFLPPVFPAKDKLEIKMLGLQMRRRETPGESAHLADFLVSDEAGWITGQTTHRASGRCEEYLSLQSQYRSFLQRPSITIQIDHLFNLILINLDL